MPEPSRHPIDRAADATMSLRALRDLLAGRPSDLGLLHSEDLYALVDLILREMEAAVDGLSKPA